MRGHPVGVHVFSGGVSYEFGQDLTQNRRSSFVHQCPMDGFGSEMVVGNVENIGHRGRGLEEEAEGCGMDGREREG